MTERNFKRSRGWIPIAVLATLVLYPLSFGPACWIVARWESLVARRFLEAGYFPIVWTLINGPQPVRKCIEKYANIGSGTWAIFIHNGHIGFNFYIRDNLQNPRTPISPNEELVNALLLEYAQEAAEIPHSVTTGEHKTPTSAVVDSDKGSQ